MAQSPYRAQARRTVSDRCYGHDGPVDRRRVQRERLSTDDVSRTCRVDGQDAVVTHTHPSVNLVGRKLRLKPPQACVRMQARVQHKSKHQYMRLDELLGSIIATPVSQYEVG